MKVVSAQSMLLSKSLRMQQDLEDKKLEVIIEGLESKIKDQAAALEKKDFELQTMEGYWQKLKQKLQNWIRSFSQNQKTSTKKSKNLIRSLKLRSKKVQVCKNH
jgi:ATPase subunit of ABC transporter with duplicated ATPase domains